MKITDELENKIAELGKEKILQEQKLNNIQSKVRNIQEKKDNVMNEKNNLKILSHSLKAKIEYLNINKNTNNNSMRRF